MKKTNLWIAAGLAVLAALAWYVLQKSSKTISGSAVNQVFAFPDTGLVDRIVVTQRGGRSSRHILERMPDNSWRIDSSVEAAPAMSEQVLLTLNALKVKRPCTKAEREIVIKDMAVKNEKIEVYSKGERVHTFYLGGVTDEAQGNYALLEGSEEPVVVNMPNWQGYVSPRFEIDRVAWRNKHLFRSVPRSLLQVQVQYPTHPEDDFEVNANPGKGFELVGVAHPDTGRLFQFLTYFGQIYVEEYLDNAREADSLLKARPLAIVKVKDLNPKNSHELRLFDLPEKLKDPRSKEEHIFGLIVDQKQAISLQPQNYRPLLVRKADLTKPTL